MDRSPRHTSWRLLRQAGARLGRAACVVALVIVVIGGLAPVDTGPLALTAILAPHLALASAALAIPVAFASRERPDAGVLVLAILAVALLLGSDLVSVPTASATGPGVRVATWNIEIGAESADEMVAPILASAADVVAVVELTPEAAALLEADPRIRARFPSRALAPVPGSQGIGILSTVPISAPEVRMDHLGMHVTARTAAGRIEIVAVHPLPGETQFAGFLPALPVGYDTRDRDERVAAVRAWIEAVRADRPDRPLVLLGDMNVTPSERPYAAVAAGLLDAHREVGKGTGWSWRPASFSRSPLALLRIDYVFTTPDLRPRATGSDCAVASDHCLLWADLGGPSRE